MKNRKLPIGVSQNRLRKNYDNFEQFEHYSELYNLAGRLGYKSARAAWDANPTIQYSSNPRDFCRVDKLGRRFARNDNWGAGELTRQDMLSR